MKIILQIVTVLVLTKVALSTTNETVLAVETTEISMKAPLRNLDAAEYNNEIEDKVVKLQIDEKPLETNQLPSDTATDNSQKSIPSLESKETTQLENNTDFHDSHRSITNLEFKETTELPNDTVIDSSQSIKSSLEFEKTAELQNDTTFDDSQSSITNSEFKETAELQNETAFDNLQSSITNLELKETTQLQNNIDIDDSESSITNLGLKETKELPDVTAIDSSQSIKTSLEIGETAKLQNSTAIDDSRSSIINVEMIETTTKSSDTKLDIEQVTKETDELLNLTISNDVTISEVRKSELQEFKNNLTTVNSLKSEEVYQTVNELTTKSEKLQTESVNDDTTKESTIFNLEFQALVGEIPTNDLTTKTDTINITTESVILNLKTLAKEIPTKNQDIAVTNVVSQSSNENLFKTDEYIEQPTTKPESFGDEPQSIELDIPQKPLITLEDYAVKQMIFILDHILISSQEFVSKVLQATGNSIFQRDPLKRYAENLDFLLNPEEDYSEEEDIIKETPIEDPYNSILRKLAFLKGKATKQLQRHLPVDWVKPYKTSKTELAIWLDKASEQMRTEFNRYITYEDDPLKHQYFNEAFDDISRANEIHQKLAIIADLIKIVKNKKQITFMDLYMQ